MQLVEIEPETRKLREISKRDFNKASGTFQLTLRDYGEVSQRREDVTIQNGEA